MSKKEELLSKVNQYYTDKIIRHGITPAGVDWNSAEWQEFRFKQLLKVLPEDTTHFSLLDYGCGFGSTYDYLAKNYENFEYLGFDISEEMIKNAIRLFPPSSLCNWKTALSPADKKDYVISSGIFNVKQSINGADWSDYIMETLHHMNDLAVRGFSFNALTKYSDAAFMRDDLYYADPLLLFDYCKKHFSKYVALLHDYPLYEFSILVKK